MVVNGNEACKYSLNANFTLSLTKAFQSMPVKVRQMQREIDPCALVSICRSDNMEFFQSLMVFLN